MVLLPIPSLPLPVSSCGKVYPSVRLASSEQGFHRAFILNSFCVRSWFRLILARYFPSNFPVSLVTDQPHIRSHSFCKSRHASKIRFEIATRRFSKASSLRSECSRIASNDSNKLLAIIQLATSSLRYEKAGKGFDRNGLNESGESSESSEVTKESRRRTGRVIRNPGRKGFYEEDAEGQRRRHGEEEKGQVRLVMILALSSWGGNELTSTVVLS